MKFTFDRNAMINEISIAQEIISTKNALSVLSNVLLIAEGGTLTIKATDIKEQGAGASGVNVVRVTEPDYIVGIDKVQENADDE